MRLLPRALTDCSKKMKFEEHEPNAERIYVQRAHKLPKMLYCSRLIQSITVNAMCARSIEFTHGARRECG